MVPMNILLGRVANQLEDMADRLSRVTVSNQHGADRASDVKVSDIAALQDIDYVEQMSRSLATFVGALARIEQAGDGVMADALLAGLPLERLRSTLAGMECGRVAPSELELF